MNLWNVLDEDRSHRCWVITSCDRRPRGKGWFRGVQADAFMGMGHSDEQGVHAAEMCVRDDFLLHACTVISLNSRFVERWTTKSAEAAGSPSNAFFVLTALFTES